MASNQVADAGASRPGAKRLVDRDGALLGKSVDSQDLPYFSSVFSPKLQLSIYTGGFLGLGDSSQMGKIKDATLDENNTVALCSALMLTVQFAFLVLHLDEDYEGITEIWGNTSSGQPWGEVFEDVSIPAQVAIITIQCIALFHAVIMILAVGEMTGEAEIMRLLELLGKSANGGFVGFFIALALFAAYVIFWCVMHMKRTGAIIGLFVPFVIVIFIMMFLWPSAVNIIRCMYLVKREVPKAVGNTTRPSPIVLSKEQVAQRCEEFAKLLDDRRLVSPDNFRSYLQEVDLEEHEEKLGKRELSWMTAKAMEEVLEDLYLKEYTANKKE